jgi:6-phosphogluconolactonase (cycloisomerase 2 family)
MGILKQAFSSLAFLCLTLTTSLAATTTEFLYILENHNKLVAYSVNSTTAKPTQLGHISLVASDPIAVVHAPSSPFLYVIGFKSKTKEFIWTYSINAKGIPNTSPIQTTQVKPALSQFYIHPNGTFAYALYFWQQWDPVNKVQDNVSDITLFTIDTKTGKLTNTKKAVANFPPDFNYRTFMHGLSSKGTKLYTEADFVGEGHFADLEYAYLTINPKTGTLSKPVPFWSDTLADFFGISAFTDTLIVQPEGNTPSIRVFPNTSNPKKPLFTCTSSMVQPCGDFVINVVFDPSGKFLFVSDDATGTTPILRVDTAHKKMEELTNFLPGSTTPVFSHDGRMVYAIQRDSKTVMSTTFNPATGELGANSSLPVPTGSVIFAW